MEAVGLTVGLLALVGVFEDCVTLLSQFGAAKSIGKDYSYLATRLDFQRTLLLQWAERLKLYDNREYDAPLKDPSLKDLIQSGLQCIIQLLQDGHLLQDRYGVRPANIQEAAETSTALSSRLSLRISKQSLGLWKLHNHAASQHDHTDSSHTPSDADSQSRLRTSDKVRWVIKDKEQFESLVRKLSDLLMDLDRVIPPLQLGWSHQIVLENEIKKLKSVRELRKVMNASVFEDSNLIDVTTQTIDRECTRSILNRLWFRLIDDRKNHIAEAHSKTLEWAINPPASGVVWDDLGQWLRSGHGIYWIHGKPGSGKSTLMKFLYNHPRIMSLLNEWASGRKLTVASFFLWNIGSSEQNSQEGLARGLLYHVLQQNQGLIPAVLPDMWQEAQIGVVDLKVPSKAETKIAFERVCAETTEGAFAFFIDGLDEFNGNHRDGISFVKSLVTSAHIKILVSSRPIDTCVAAFSSAPMLRLQDLTASDIATYINDVVRAHPYTAEHSYLSGKTVQRLVNDIRRKADGVFLWVVLACRALIEGLEAYDDEEELRRRVDELPPELESLFQHILNGLPPRYLQQAAKLLRVCYVNRLLQIEAEISAFGLAWAHVQDMDISKLGNFVQFSLDQRKEKYKILEGRLRSRCRGLLEFRTPVSDETPSIDFMHRTVFEYLSVPDVWKMDCLQIHERQFDANTILAYMSCYELYLYEGLEDEDHDPLLVVSNYVRKVEESSPSNLPHLLNSFAFALTYRGESKEKREVSLMPALLMQKTASMLAVELDLTTFVKSQSVRKFNALPRSHRSGGNSEKTLLYHAFKKPLTLHEGDPCSSIMIGHLVRSGCGPNQSIALNGKDTRTCWDIWMQSKHMKDDAVLAPLQSAEITMIMIRAGAVFVPFDPSDPNAIIPHITVRGYRTRLKEKAEQWLEFSPTLENAREQQELRALCNEILETVAASYGNRP
ncbi:unnamed protein product [Alternaria alternata]